MRVIAEGILKGCQGLFTPVSLGYPLSVFNKNSTLNPWNGRGRLVELTDGCYSEGDSQGLPGFTVGVDVK